MRLYLNDELQNIKSLDELKSFLQTHNKTGAIFRLVEETSGETLRALCVLHSDTETLYSLSHTSTEGITEKFASPKDCLPDIEWVTKSFESFYLGDGQWHGYSEWSETYSSRALLFFLIAIVFITGLYLTGKHFFF